MQQLFLIYFDDGAWITSSRGKDALDALEGHFAEQEMHCSSQGAEDSHLRETCYPVDSTDEEEVLALLDDSLNDALRDALEPFVLGKTAWSIAGTLSGGELIDEKVIALRRAGSDF